MPTTTSDIFYFLEAHPSFSTERHEISMAMFGVLRRSVRSIVVSLREGGDLEAGEECDRLRNALSEWLTVPIPFDGAILAALQTFGVPALIEAKWGHDIRSSFDSALLSAHAIQTVENPVRERLRTVIRELRVAGRPFKIYCHRTARAHFETLFSPSESVPLGEKDFLHSVRDYRESSTFDTLIKVGPLRSWGWGSAPDAIKAAPKFGTLVQIVWAGCSDEPGFGYDPVAPPGNELVAPGMPVANDGGLGTRISWTPRVTQFGDGGADKPHNGTPEQDEFQIFERLNQPGQKRRATLVQIDGEHGILYPLHYQVLSFDPAPGARDPVWPRLPGETLLEGMFVVRPLLGDVDLGAQQSGHGDYSRTWKVRLIEEKERDTVALVERLRAAGLNLVCLPADIRNWCVAPSTVIHAPHRKKHFEILIRVLGLGADANGHPGSRAIPWWQSAWNEIRHSRGEAIQAGLHGQEIVEKELMAILNGLLADIRLHAAAKTEFSILIPAGQTLRGAALFNRLSLIEEGFFAPETELRFVRELNTIEQWRA